jgi:hypothetical protein
MSEKPYWVNPNQWVVNLGCKIKYSADSMDELAIADLILEACEVRERKAKADGLREAANICDESAKVWRDWGDTMNMAASNGALQNATSIRAAADKLEHPEGQ